MCTFDPHRKYTPDEVATLDPRLYKKLSEYHTWVPGEWYANSVSVRRAANALFDDGACRGDWLNAAT